MPPPRFERRDFLGEALRAQELEASQRQAEERRRALESKPCPPDPQLQLLLSDFVIRMNHKGEKPPCFLVDSGESSQGSNMGWKLSTIREREVLSDLDHKSGSSSVKPWQGIAVGTNLGLWKATATDAPIILSPAAFRRLEVEPFRGPSITDAIEKYIHPNLIGNRIDGARFKTVYEYIAFRMARLIRGER